jgi:hypothetical protein
LIAGACGALETEASRERLGIFLAAAVADEGAVDMTQYVFRPERAKPSLPRGLGARP